MTAVILSPWPRYALRHVQSSDVKTFAQQMIDDHARANEPLTKLATKDNIKVPTSPVRPDGAVLTD